MNRHIRPWSFVTAPALATALIAAALVGCSEDKKATPGDTDTNDLIDPDTRDNDPTDTTDTTDNVDPVDTDDTTDTTDNVDPVDTDDATDTTDTTDTADEDDAADTTDTIDTVDGDDAEHDEEEQSAGRNPAARAAASSDAVAQRTAAARTAATTRVTKPTSPAQAAKLPPIRKTQRTVTGRKNAAEPIFGGEDIAELDDDATTGTLNEDLDGDGTAEVIVVFVSPDHDGAGPDEENVFFAWEETIEGTDVCFLSWDDDGTVFTVWGECTDDPGEQTEVVLCTADASGTVAACEACNVAGECNTCLITDESAACDAPNFELGADELALITLGNVWDVVDFYKDAQGFTPDSGTWAALTGLEGIPAAQVGGLDLSGSYQAQVLAVEFDLDGDGDVSPLKVLKDDLGTFLVWKETFEATDGGGAFDVCAVAWVDPTDDPATDTAYMVWAECDDDTGAWIASAQVDGEGEVVGNLAFEGCNGDGECTTCDIFADDVECEWPAPNPNTGNDFADFAEVYFARIDDALTALRSAAATTNEFTIDEFAGFDVPDVFNGVTTAVAIPGEFGQGSFDIDGDGTADQVDVFVSDDPAVELIAWQKGVLGAEICFLAFESDQFSELYFAPCASTDQYWLCNGPNTASAAAECEACNASGVCDTCDIANEADLCAVPGSR